MSFYELFFHIYHEFAKHNQEFISKYSLELVIAKYELNQNLELKIKDQFFNFMLDSMFKSNYEIGFNYILNQSHISKYKPFILKVIDDFHSISDLSNSDFERIKTLQKKQLKQ